MSRVIDVGLSPLLGPAAITNNPKNSSTSLGTPGTRSRQGQQHQPSATAGPGPSTVAAARSRSRRTGRTAATNTQVIELTDSDSDGPVDDEGPQRQKRRVEKTASLVSAGAPTSRPAASKTPGGPGANGGRKAKAVPLFLEDDEDGRQGTDALQGNVNAVPPPAHGLGRNNQENVEAGRPDTDQAEGDPAGEQIAPDAAAPPQAQQQQQQHDQQQPEGQGDDAQGGAEKDGDAILGIIAQVLEIIPDVAPDYLLALLLQLYPQHKNNTVNTALTMLFDDPQYPKVDRKGKRKSDGAHDHRPGKKAKIEYVDYSRQDREPVGSQSYVDLALEHLQTSFPYVPKPYLRKVLGQRNHLYAPSHVYFAELYKRYGHPPKDRPPLSGPASGSGSASNFPFIPRKTPYRTTGVLRGMQDAELDKERGWVVAYDEAEGDLVELRAKLMSADADGESGDGDGKGKGKEGPAAEQEEEEEEEEEEEDCPEGEGIECGCCFTEYSFEKMIQCPETHLFCKSCMKTYASNLLGSHDVRLKCMHQSGCSLLFPESELRRVLPQKLVDLYDRVKQQKEIEEADLEGLEECPFCEYKCVIEADKTQEKLFRCGNIDGGCGAVSCRECKRPDHLPKSCKEMDEGKVLDGQHVVEEAMSAALMRSCPKCKKPFIKESGCNKITCYNCTTTSCYVCRKSINGYDHFDRTPATGTTSKASTKCPLWDPVDARHAEEVKAAAERAIADFRAEHPDVDTEAMKVDVPKAPPPPQPNVVPLGYINPFHNALGLQVQINPMPILNPPPPVQPNPPRGRIQRGRGRRRAQIAPLIPPIPAAPPIQPIQQIQGAAAVPFVPAFQLLPNFQPLGHNQLPPPPPRFPAAVGVPQVQAFDFNFNALANVNQNPVPVQNPPGRRRARR